MKYRIIYLVFFIFPLVSCASKGNPKEYLDIPQSELKEIPNLTENEKKEAFDGRFGQIKGAARFLVYSQVFVLDDEKMSPDNPEFISLYNCLQLLVPDDLLEKYPKGKIMYLSLSGNFIFNDYPFYNDEEYFDNLVPATYEIMGIGVRPSCGEVNHLFFKVDKIERVN